MLEDGPFEDDPVTEALRDQPGEVYGRVDADRGEDRPGVDPRAEGLFRKQAELPSRVS